MITLACFNIIPCKVCVDKTYSFNCLLHNVNCVSFLINAVNTLKRFILYNIVTANCGINGWNKMDG